MPRKKKEDSDDDYKFINDDDDEEEDDYPFNKNDEPDNIISVIKKNIKIRNNIINKNKNKKYTKILEKYNKDEIVYFNNLDESEKNNIYNIETSLNNNNLLNINTPLRFKFLNMNTSDMNKYYILTKYEQLCSMSPYSSEYFKLYSWINTISNIPLGNYHKLPITNTDNISNISNFLINIKKELDNKIYGHIEAKEHIIRILSQWISYPNAKGYIIGIQGAMGIGKTKLIKDGICNVLKYPFSFISLGGISDSSYLKGHSFTYEGSKYGKIVESLMKAKVMNPIFFFDELDKVSDTKLGEEIINTLIHITDNTQNEKFTDRYFEEIDLDISKSIIFFSYNDESLINPILKDRMITIKVKGYNINDKIIIAQDYLLKDIMKEYNLNYNDIIFTNDIIKLIIELTDDEEGVRNLQRNINNIISHINMYKYLPSKDININFPYTITKDICEKFCKKKHTTDIKLSMYL